MYLPKSYKEAKIWPTIDVEELEDANFGIRKKEALDIDYEKIIMEWIELCRRHHTSSCAFVLGNFAKKYPKAVKRLAQNGHEIACHGLNHELVYNIPFKRWVEETKEAKKILEDITGQKVEGYRSPSWSMPFEKRYYEALVYMGFKFSSSYFPFKTYMYGNEIDKKRPFKIFTQKGVITEIPVPKNVIPFSGGFYFRILPYAVTRYLFADLMKKGIKPIIYTHPYELMDHLFTRFANKIKMDTAFLLTFAGIGDTKKKFDKLMDEFLKEKS